MTTLFTKIINGEIPSHKLYEDDAFYSFLDINPISKGHSLLIPKVETDYFFSDLDEAVRIRNEKGDLSSLAQKYINIAYELGGEDWYGAEKIWDTDIFRDRLRSLNLGQ